MNILKKLLEIKIFHTSNFPMDYRGKKEKKFAVAYVRQSKVPTQYRK